MESASPCVARHRAERRAQLFGLAGRHRLARVFRGLHHRGRHFGRGRGFHGHDRRRARPAATSVRPLPMGRVVSSRTTSTAAPSRCASPRAASMRGHLGLDFVGVAAAASAAVGSLPAMRRRWPSYRRSGSLSEFMRSSCASGTLHARRDQPAANRRAAPRRSPRPARVAAVAFSGDGGDHRGDRDTLGGLRRADHARQLLGQLQAAARRAAARWWIDCSSLRGAAALMP